jgi:alpha-L-fucosidase
MLKEFTDLKFGMFIHYNMATYKGVQWVSGYPDPSEFDPGGPIDTDAWADAAKAAGMTYGVLTAKHVSGFCLWDSALTRYGVMHPDCPYGQDLVAQFVKSFTSRGLKAGIYYCWRTPGFDNNNNNGKFKVLPPECDPADTDFEAQVAFQKKQLAELLQKFPEVFYLWHDGLDPLVMSQEDAQAFVRSLGHGVIHSSNWWDWGKKGEPFVDVAVKEMRHFTKPLTAPGETCWALEKGWFWNEETETKSLEEIRTAMHTAWSMNSNFLLNVGPDRRGKILPASLEVLEALAAES